MPISRSLLILACATVCAAAQDFSALPLLKTYTQERMSSFDRTGANDDGGTGNRIKPGETRVLGDVLPAPALSRTSGREADEMIFIDGHATPNYRFHLDSPIPFEKYFKMTIEHGHANHRSDNFYTMAYWYQQGPHRLSKPLPPVAERIPRMINTEGPTVGKP